MRARTFDKTTTNICKGIAIILMYIHHSFYSKDSFRGMSVIFAPLTQGQTVAIARLCKVCVSIFVFLSAYGVYRSSHVSQTPARSFFKEKYLPTVWRRYRTLLWNFVVIYFLSQLLSPLIGVSRVSIYGESLIKRMAYTVIDGLGLANLFSTPTYNGTWWYMPLAFLLIFLLPVLVYAAEYLGYALLSLAILLPPLMGFNMDAHVFRYLIAMVMGLLCAKYDWMEKLEAWMHVSKLRFAAGVILSLLAILSMLIGRRVFGHAYLVEGFNAAFICFFGFAVLQMIPGISQLLALLGKHSMNMFLTHTLIRGASMRLHAFSYAPRYPVLIILLLLADTLLLSMLIEWLKKQIVKLQMQFRQ